jgi:hypothetical protein
MLLAWGKADVKLIISQCESSGAAMMWSCVPRSCHLTREVNQILPVISNKLEHIQNFSQHNLNFESRTSVVEAYRNGDERSAKLLFLRIRDDIGLVNSTLFDLASLEDDYRSEFQDRGQANIVKFLLAHENFNINERNLDGKTLLLKACFHGSSVVAEQLLAPRIPISQQQTKAKKRDSCTRVWGGHGGVVTQLLKRDDIDVNAKDNSGEMGLINACHKGSRDIVE